MHESGHPAQWSSATRTVIVAVLILSVRVPGAQASDRIERLNQAFLEHLDTLGQQHALAVATIRRGWQETYRGQAPEGFVPDALAVLYPQYRETLQAFDLDQLDRVVALARPLQQRDDPFLVANATYFLSRAMIGQARLEEAQALLFERAEADNARYTPYAPHLWLMRGYCQASNLEFDGAVDTLRELDERYPDAPESVRVGARQLLLALERRQPETLDEVSAYMDYSATRLKVTDTNQKVRDRQERIVEMLDKLIEEAQQREEQQQQGGGSSQAQGQPRGQPRSGREQSIAPGGAGRIGELHNAPRANPGEMWGKLPPTQREDILQSIRDRFPSRYRQLVEQYYRSLAEQK